MKKTIALTMLLTAAAAVAFANEPAPADEEPTFQSAGVTVAPPPPPPTKPRLVKGIDSFCPPGTKNEVCRCVIFDMSNGKQRFVPAAGDPDLPGYCRDPRLKAAEKTMEEVPYVNLLMQVQQEYGVAPHDG